MTREEKFMEEAIRLSREGSRAGEGGPFGCVIVKGEEIIGRGNNKVLLLNDPTAHAEMVAIRDACRHLGDYQLEGCEVYTSCEPCPMCLGALYWARPDRIYFANNREDSAAIGFDDSLIYQEIPLPVAERMIPTAQIGREQAIIVFEEWPQYGDQSLA
jgi:tRNA(Arg) A34 adenosine deaminase TadA